MDQVRRWMEMARLPISGEMRPGGGATHPGFAAGCEAAIAEARQAADLAQQQLGFITGSMSQPADAASAALAALASAGVVSAESAAQGAAAAGAAGAAGGYGSADPAQLAQYANYVAALQLQQAAMANLGVQAGGQFGSSYGGDHPLGPRTERPTGSRHRDGPIQPHDPSRRFIGSVFKWDDDAGWGFLSCLDARKVYGKDVFLHKAEIGGVADLYKQRKAVEVKNGDWVEFSVEISRGKPRARDVTKVDAPEEYRNAPKGAGGPQLPAGSGQGGPWAPQSGGEPPLPQSHSEGGPPVPGWNSFGAMARARPNGEARFPSGSGRARSRSRSPSRRRRD